jgi:hypothetical protein
MSLILTAAPKLTECSSVPKVFEDEDSGLKACSKWMEVPSGATEAKTIFLYEYSASANPCKSQLANTSIGRVTSDVAMHAAFARIMASAEDSEEA